jgi:hypothetical protein
LFVSLYYQCMHFNLWYVLASESEVESEVWLQSKGN